MLLAFCRIREHADQQRASELLDQLSEQMGIDRPQIRADNEFVLRSDDLQRARNALDQIDPDWHDVLAIPSPHL